MKDIILSIPGAVKTAAAGLVAVVLM